MSEEYEVLYNLLPELAAAMREFVSQAVRKAAFDIQKAAADSAPVDTGFLASSIYTVTNKESTYGQGIVDGSPGSHLLDEVTPPESDTEAVVGVGANYGVYVEMGTAHAPAQPYLIPAAEAERPKLVAALTRMEEALKSGGLGGSGESGN